MKTGLKPRHEGSQRSSSFRQHREKGKFTVLHLTPHLGGGVGRVLLNYLDHVKKDPDFLHQVICLDYANEKALSASRAIGFSLQEKMSANHPGILSEIASADIVLVHWWNHPLLYDLLVRTDLPPSRLILWSHVSGFHPPSVFTKAILDYPDLFVLTTPASMKTTELGRLPDEQKSALRVIWSTGGVADVSIVHKTPHRGHRIGYIGTVDYSKMHPHFVSLSLRVKSTDVQFIVCGGPSEQSISEETAGLGVADRFQFTGEVDNVLPYLSQFDVFGYPLSPYHFGTCEQSLGEAMAAGIPPVVFSNPAELEIVQHRVNGLVAETESQYAAGIDLLCQQPGLRQALSENARRTAKSRFSMDTMVKKWTLLFEEILTRPKRPREWKGPFGGTGMPVSRVFLESLGDYGQVFSRSLRAENGGDSEAAIAEIQKTYHALPIWKSRTRGTPNHYHSFFPGDKALELWSRLSRQ